MSAILANAVVIPFILIALVIFIFIIRYLVDFITDGDYKPFNSFLHNLYDHCVDGFGGPTLVFLIFIIYTIICMFINALAMSDRITEFYSHISIISLTVCCCVVLSPFFLKYMYKLCKNLNNKTSVEDLEDRLAKLKKEDK